MIYCPKCGSDRFFYTRPTRNFYRIISIDKDGSIIHELEDSYEDDLGNLQCFSCHWTGTVEDYFKIAEAIK